MISGIHKLTNSTQIAHRRADFDVTKGTILDSELRPEHFREVTCAIFQNLDLGKCIRIFIPYAAYLKEQHHRLSKHILRGRGNAQR
jgi:hypothetical protein